MKFPFNNIPFHIRGQDNGLGKVGVVEEKGGGYTLFY